MKYLPILFFCALLTACNNEPDCEDPIEAVITDYPNGQAEVTTINTTYCGCQGLQSVAKMTNEGAIEILKQAQQEEEFGSDEYKYYETQIAIFKPSTVECD
jgi:hypothetical protein